MSTVASYIVTFLKPEMLHVYRQVTGLRRWKNIVICKKRENPDHFPFPEVRTVKKSPLHQVRRWWQKQVRHEPITIGPSETRRLRAEILCSGADLLHVYFGHIGVHLLPMLQECPIPFVVSFHGADAQVDLDQPKHASATQKMLSLAKLLLVRSDSIAAKLRELGCPPEKIRIHRTGIPLDRIPFRQRVAPADGAWHCLQACRLIEKKGIETTMRAFAAFSAVYPKARLTIAGEGPMLMRIGQLAEELKIGRVVQTPGFLSQSDLGALFDSAHLFLHPSELGGDGNQEGVPNSMLEAMSAGIPPLATFHGGIPEAVENGVSGILVKERDSTALGLELIALAQSPARYEKMSTSAAARVASQFDIRATVESLESYYDEAIAGADRR
jgi:colanic acid/amylovoran biosynthesis glycosyltransferase